MKKGKTKFEESKRIEIASLNEEEPDYVNDIKHSFISLGIAAGIMAVIFSIYYFIQLIN